MQREKGTWGPPAGVDQYVREQQVKFRKSIMREIEENLKLEVENINFRTHSVIKIGLVLNNPQMGIKDTLSEQIITIEHPPPD